MTDSDSDTESFHSAVDSLPDLDDDTNGEKISGKCGFGEKKVGNSKSECDRFTEVTDEISAKYPSNKLSIPGNLPMDTGKIMATDPVSCEKSRHSIVPENQDEKSMSEKAEFDRGATKVIGNIPREKLPLQTAVKHSDIAGSGCEESNKNIRENEAKLRSKNGKSNGKTSVDNFEQNTETRISNSVVKQGKSSVRTESTDAVKAVLDEKPEETTGRDDVDRDDGWDVDWEFEYPETGKRVMGNLVDDNADNDDEKSKTEVLPRRRPSVEWKKESNGRESKMIPETEPKVKENKSFWNWTEFGGMVAAVGEGITSISSAVESSLGLPAPEELARYESDETRIVPDDADVVKKSSDRTSADIKSYGKLFAGFGANVVTGSLDVLEALGKKTFEKLTVPEQGTEKRRFIFEPERGQNLSEVLRELRESKAEETLPETSCITKRELTFIDFFEKFSGMLHLEGMEMLSKNHLRKIPAQRRREVDEIFAEDLGKVLEDYQDDEQEDFTQQFKEILLATGLPYNGSGLIDCHKRCQERLQRLPDSGDQVFEFFLECLADFTAQSVQSIHKMGQLLLITATAVRQQPFSDFHGLIGRQISFYSNQFAQHINVVSTPCEETDELVTTVFLAAGDAFSYVQQSFRLLRPLLIL